MTDTFGCGEDLISVAIADFANAV
ncbi:hypothetical protein [Aminobacter sp. SS-2016]